MKTTALALTLALTSGCATMVTGPVTAKGPCEEHVEKFWPTTARWGSMILPPIGAGVMQRQRRQYLACRIENASSDQERQELVARDAAQAAQFQAYVAQQQAANAAPRTYNCAPTVVGLSPNSVTCTEQ